MTSLGKRFFLLLTSKLEQRHIELARANGAGTILSTAEPAAGVSGMGVEFIGSPSLAREQESCLMLLSRLQEGDQVYFEGLPDETAREVTVAVTQARATLVVAQQAATG
jgi:hypothetical protein